MDFKVEGGFLMGNQNAEEFLDLYKQLETAAVRVVGKDGRGSSIVRLAKHPRFSDHQNELDCCREIRNLLSHEVRIDGDFAVCPSDRAIAFLRQMLSRIEQPPLAISRAALRNRLLVAQPEDSVLALAHQMQARSISHVPLLSDGMVTGVFSENVIFEAMLHRRHVQITEETPLSVFADFLALTRTLGKTYQFLPESATLDEASELFSQSAHRKEPKLKLLFLTKSGRTDEPLLGLLSPYDVLDRG